MEQEHKSLHGALLIILTFLVLLIIMDFLFYNKLITVSSTGFLFILKGVFSKLTAKMLMVRSIYVVLLYLLAFLNPSFKLGKNMSDSDKRFYIICSSILSLLVIIGFSRFFVYNFVFYPIIFFLDIFFVAKAVASMRKKFKDEDFFSKITCEESANNFKFDLETEKGLMRIHAPEENIFIDGGPGSGKSHYLIKFFIHQAAFNQYSGFVYDFEGDPTKKGSPILTRIAYSSIVAAKQHIGEDYFLKFAFINFNDMSRTVRVNVLSKNYYNESTMKMFIRNMSTSLMKNLEPSWKEKTDFWAGNAINFVSSIMYVLCKKYSDKGYNTLPHVISLCLCPSDHIFRWLKSDDEICKTMAPMISAWEMGAQNQTAGTVSSAQLPLILLYDKNIYWVLSAKPKEEFSLDISNINSPTILCVGNSPQLKEAISPAISCIVSVLMSEMNNPGKHKSIFCADELPTINMFGLDIFIATARKHLVSTILAVQDFMQLVRDYGDKSANIIRTSCGTYFQGKTGNNKTCEEIVKGLGEIKRTNYSYSEQSQGGVSTTESQQKEKILQERDISSQESGHFFGKISNGKPPYIFTKFKPFHEIPNYTTLEIPSFSLNYNTGDPEVDIKILARLVEENFSRIESDVKDLLRPYENE